MRIIADKLFALPSLLAEQELVQIDAQEISEFAYQADAWSFAR